eukprot:TRINITY_DN4128_c0_g1_i1.p2 TRINITY_DN4128_c0_g1~~TRINITY_DN4128_c0_g1_i1.p2  ORF type:complete len:102 (-),score=12.86 TRINITY_DN4128_c0_g1_i1:195-500(-)
MLRICRPGSIIFLGRRVMASQPGAAPGGHKKAQRQDPIVQYVALRQDLSQPPLQWPGGAVTSQACHACTVAVWEFKEDPTVVEYFADIAHLRKVVVAVRCL